MYLYKKNDGKCWYETINVGTNNEKNDDEKNGLIDLGQTVLHPFEDNVQEKEFM